jgi:hypothetical protein
MQGFNEAESKPLRESLSSDFSLREMVNLKLNKREMRFTAETRENAEIAQRVECRSTLCESSS